MALLCGGGAVLVPVESVADGRNIWEGLQRGYSRVYTVKLIFIKVHINQGNRLTFEGQSVKLPDWFTVLRSGTSSELVLIAICCCR